MHDDDDPKSDVCTKNRCLKSTYFAYDRDKVRIQCYLQRTTARQYHKFEKRVACLSSTLRLVDFCFMPKRRHQRETFLLPYFHVFFWVRLFSVTLNASYPNFPYATKKIARWPGLKKGRHKISSTCCHKSFPDANSKMTSKDFSHDIIIIIFILLERIHLSSGHLAQKY